MEVDVDESYYLTATVLHSSLQRLLRNIYESDFYGEFSIYQKARFAALEFQLSQNDYHRKLRTEIMMVLYPTRLNNEDRGQNLQAVFFRVNVLFNKAALG